MRLKLVAFIILMSCFRASFSQVSLRVFNYRPTGDFGYVFKPTYSAELGFALPFSENRRVRFAASVSFLNLKPRLDVFPIYATVSGGGQPDAVLPGTQSFQKYNLFNLCGGIDIAIVNKDKFKFYLGTDINIGGSSVEYTSQIVTLSDEGYSGGGYLLGFRGRLGIDYSLSEKFIIFASAQRSYFLLNEPATLGSANDYGIGIRFQFMNN